MDDLGEPTWGMRVTLALLILLFISPSSEDSGRCVPRSCRDFDEECWSNAESLSSQGEALADQGRFSDAMQCFTYAANSLQDERLLSRPSALPYERRRVLFRLYSSASLAILRARRGGGAVGDDWLKTWLRRAVQIVSPSAQILFDENDLDEEQEAASKTPPDRADVESCQRKECEEHAREKDWDSAFFCQQDFLLCSSLRLPASKSAMASLAWQIFRLGAFGHLHGNFHLVERLISDLEAFELGQEPEEMKTLKLNNLVSMAKAYEKSEKYAASLKAYGRLDYLVLA
ncbi:hypothetical protein GUITHDRAFT_99032 [Guillardia theta CCMP2712]|uniref:KIF-binding protein n=1 Tax=Guillardia theta (strain CCMP2712) TaxID=905079 RepID=L1K3S8_GUITC|nr:hypothetical protein GUITHDRAFT_99032 [Guillardia theta CCMP2712]EKX55249.1 hypothetical protein GUITHDRAFT_99032 [Guillardia theta CCMP2712]|eukprot:XP_005842229.1 hypothetical protein GUITHDRAFT_99032 [Guillardia theta CCMP2712]